LTSSSSAAFCSVDSLPLPAATRPRGLPPRTVTKSPSQRQRERDQQHEAAFRRAQAVIRERSDQARERQVDRALAFADRRQRVQTQPRGLAPRVLLQAQLAARPEVDESEVAETVALSRPTAPKLGDILDRQDVALDGLSAAEAHAAEVKARYILRGLSSEARLDAGGARRRDGRTPRPSASCGT